MTVKTNDPTQRQKPRNLGELVGGVSVDVNDELPDLDDTFKVLVTSSIDEILEKRPADPIRFLADCLMKRDNSHEMEIIEYVVGDNTRCTLSRACTRKDGAEVLHVPGMPLMKLVTPTSFELDAALRHLNEITPEGSKIIIFIEPASPPTELFFLKGVPYFTDITAKLLQQRRDGVRDRTLDSSLGSPEKIIAHVKSALQMNIKSLREEIAAVAVPASRYRIVEFPILRWNPLEVFDTISTSLGVKNYHWDDPPLPQTEVPAAIFVSFSPNTSSMTFSRIIAGMLPLYEQVQRGKIATTLENNRLHIAKLNYRYVTNYWVEVMQRRDERDRVREMLKAENSRRRLSARTLSHQRSRSRSPSPERGGQTSTRRGVCESANLRVQRREREDTVFFRVLHQLRSQAAVRIQAFYRGYRLRKKMGPRTAVRTAVDDVPCWVEEFPPSLPVLLRRCVERLSAMYGELFGNYVASCPPVPRYVTVLKPIRGVLRATNGGGGGGGGGDDGDDDDNNNINDDVDSETELWEEEQVALPLVRLTKPPPHFNLLRRLMECECLGGCNTIKHAMGIQLDCNGLSVLQRRAYDCYKSLVLNLLYITFLELYYRRKLTPLTMSFGEYVHRFHMDVLGWFSVPHLFSQIAIRCTASSPVDVPILCNEVVETERVLLMSPHTEGKIYAGAQRQKMREQAEQHRNEHELPLCTTMSVGESDNVWDCAGVYAAPAFLSEVSWEGALKELVLEGRGKNVAWWSLHFNPAAYIAGEPVILSPRHELEPVIGRPRFDELVSHLEVTKVRATAPAPCVLSRSRVSSRADRPRRYSGVNDGLFSASPQNTSLAPLTPLSLAPIPVSSPLAVDGESDLSPFSISLRWEDYHLAQMVSREMEAHHTVKVFNYMKDSLSSSLTVPVIAPWLRVCFVEAITERKTENPTLPDDPLTSVSLPASMGRSVQLHPIKHGSWFKTIENARRNTVGVDGLHASFSFCTNTPLREPQGHRENTPRRHGGSQTQVFTPVDVQCVDGMAHRVARRVVDAENFVHERPWITPVCSRAGGVFFDHFVSKCLAQMREGYTLVLTVDQPFHLMFFNAVCLLKHAMLHPPESHLSASSTTWYMTKLAKPGPKYYVGLLSEDTSNCLAFMSSFYDEAVKLTQNSTSALQECVHVVQNVMRVNSPGGMMFLDELPTLIKNAERETDRRILEESILTIVQRVELYCWLILFQVFIHSFAMADVFEKNSSTKLPLFSVFIKDTSAMEWMERIDPWQNAPELSPDPFHLRYSNGMRRWDDRSYIYRGAI